MTPHASTFDRRLGRTGSLTCRLASGFTLVELLVVISIIALLIAMLLPALGEARQQALNTRCGSNLRQMAIAALSYATEHADHVPGVNFDDALPDMNYLTSDLPMYCPFAADSANNWTAWRTPGPGWLYSMSPALSKPEYLRPAIPPGPVALLRIHSQSRAMIFTDGGWRGRTYNHYHEFAGHTLNGRTDAAWAWPQHRGSDGLSRGLNIAYLDAHVQYVRREGHTTELDYRNHRPYPFNHKPFWAIAGSRSWDMAPYED